MHPHDRECAHMLCLCLEKVVQALVLPSDAADALSQSTQIYAMPAILH